MGLYDPELKRIRAVHIVHLKTTKGLNNIQVGKELGISRDTVERSLTFAKKAGLFVDYENKIIQEIIPLALEAIKTALKDGDSETALEILRGMNVAGFNKDKAKNPVAEADDSDFHKYISEARKVKQIQEDSIEGTIIENSGLAGLLESTNPPNAAAEAPISEDSTSPERPTKSPAEKTP